MSETVVVNAAVVEGQEAQALQANPVHTAIAAKFNNLVDVKDMKFHFKTTKNSAGEEVKRPTVELAIPTPSVEGIVSILENGDKDPKSLSLLLEACSDVIASAVREYVNDNEDVKQDNLPLDKFSWAYLANLPKATRRGSGISEEQWSAFKDDYIAVMPAVTGKSVESVTMAATIFVGRLAKVRNDKDALNVLKTRLGMYAQTDKADQFSDVIEYLDKRIDELLNASNESLLNAL